MKKIIIPIDFSAVANNAVEYGARLAERINASITLLHLQKVPNVSADIPVNEYSDEMDTDREDATTKLIGYCHEIRNSFKINCNYKNLVGDLESSVIEYTEKNDYDLILIGTSGEDSMADYFFGTNTYRILQRAKKPVLIIPSTVEYQPILKIVYASNFRDIDAISAKYIRELLNGYSPELHMLHVSKGGTESSKDIFYAFQDIVMDQLGDDFNVKFIRKVNEDTTEAIDNYMQEKEIHLLAVSTTHRNFFQNLIHKSITKQILSRAEYPVLVLHE